MAGAVIWCRFIFICHLVKYCVTYICSLYDGPIGYWILTTSAGVGFSPGWETPSSPGFPTETANPRLKARL